MKCPEGLDLYMETQFKNDECVALQKSVYGLVQSARQWWKKFVEVLIKLGFKKTKIDPCLLKKEDGGKVCYFCVYVDDNLIIGDRALIDQTILELQKHFSIKKLGPIILLVVRLRSLKGKLCCGNHL